MPAIYVASLFLRGRLPRSFFRVLLLTATPWLKYKKPGLVRHWLKEIRNQTFISRMFYQMFNIHPVHDIIVM